MVARKAWKRCHAWFWIDCNQSLQPNLSQMKCNVWKPCSDQRWQDDLRFSIWRFFEQSSFVNNHLLCYWPTIHNFISKICPKFQVISSHIFEINKLLNEHWAKIVQSENIPIYVECDKMSQSEACVKEFSYFMSGLDIQLKNSKYYSPVCKKIGCRWRNTTSHIPFSLSNWYKPMAQWLRLVVESKETWVLFLMSFDMLCRPSAIMRGTEPVSTFYIAALSTIFFLGFRQWWSRADRVVLDNLNSGPGPHSPTCAGLAHWHGQRL